MFSGMGDGVGGVGDCFGLGRTGFGAGRGGFWVWVWECGLMDVCLGRGVTQYGFAGCRVGFLGLVGCVGALGVGAGAGAGGFEAG